MTSLLVNSSLVIIPKKMIYIVLNITVTVHVTVIGLPRHLKNREFECSFFQTGKTNLPRKLKIFIQGIYSQDRENFEVLKIKGYTRVVGCSYDLLAF